MCFQRMVSNSLSEHELSWARAGCSGAIPYHKRLQKPYEVFCVCLQVPEHNGMTLQGRDPSSFHASAICNSPVSHIEEEHVVSCEVCWRGASSHL